MSATRGESICLRPEPLPVRATCMPEPVCEPGSVGTKGRWGRKA